MDAQEFEMDLNDILEQWSRSMNLNSSAENSSLSHSGCQHEYASYVGLRESYRYCIKCDHKDYTNL